VRSAAPAHPPAPLSSVPSGKGPRARLAGDQELEAAALGGIGNVEYMNGLMMQASKTRLGIDSSTNRVLRPAPFCKGLKFAFTRPPDRVSPPARKGDGRLDRLLALHEAQPVSERVGDLHHARAPRRRPDAGSSIAVLLRKKLGLLTSA
jgi:hypothetical protein